MQVELHRHPFLQNQEDKNFTNRGFCTCTIVSGTLRTHNELPESIEQTGSTHLCDCRHAAFARYRLLNAHTSVITFIANATHCILYSVGDSSTCSHGLPVAAISLANATQRIQCHFFLETFGENGESLETSLCGPDQFRPNKTYKC